MVSTTSFLNSGVYHLFGTPFGIKITPPVKHYIILSNKWGAVHRRERGCFCAAKNSACSSANGVFVYRFEFYLFQLECAGVEAVVGAFLRDEVAVAATFDDVAVVEHHDDVGVLNRR